MIDLDLCALLDSREHFYRVEMQLRNSLEKVPDLMQLALYSKHRNSWRALYLADKLHDTHPGLIRPYLEKMIEQLKVEEHHAKRRILLKLIGANEVPRQYFGFLVNHCMDTFTAAKEPAANRVHALQILYNISDVEPELKPELAEVIQHEMEYHSTPAIRARGRNLLKKLRRQLGRR